MNVKLLEDVVAALAMGEPLPEKNKDHGLSGKWAGRQSIVKIDKPTFLFSFPKCERAAFRIVLEALPFPNEGKLGQGENLLYGGVPKAGRRFRQLER